MRKMEENEEISPLQLLLNGEIQRDLPKVTNELKRAVAIVIDIKNFNMTPKVISEKVHALTSS